MPFEYVCPHCHNRTKVLDRYAGQSGPCVSCGKTVTMPHFNEQGMLVAAIQLPTKSKAPNTPKEKRSWMPAMIGAAIVACLLFMTATTVIVVWPKLKQSIQRAAQGRDLDNLKSIAAALNAYADRNGTYPPPVVFDVRGKPLYSWRVLILPFLGYDDLYKQFELSQPWDSVANSNLHRAMPSEFASPNSPDASNNNETNYVLITGPGTLFPPSGPLSPKNLDNPTLLVVETKNNTIWCQPGDIDIGRRFRVGNKPMVDVGGLHNSSFTAVTVDEEGMRIPSNVPQNVLDAIVTPNGGENVQTSTFIE